MNVSLRMELVDRLCDEEYHDGAGLEVNPRHVVHRRMLQLLTKQCLEVVSQHTFNNWLHKLQHTTQSLIGQ